MYTRQITEVFTLLITLSVNKAFAKGFMGIMPEQRDEIPFDLSPIEIPEEIAQLIFNYRFFLWTY